MCLTMVYIQCNIMVKYMLISLIPSLAMAQFNSGFLVLPNTSVREFPRNLSSVFPHDISPQEHHDHHGQAVASAAEANSPFFSKKGPIQSIFRDIKKSTDLPQDKPSKVRSESGNKCSMIAFSVAKANFNHRKAGEEGTQVVFDKVLSNVGNNYNATGSYFKTQCPGYYYLTMHGVSPLQGRARLDLMRNQQRIISSEAEYYGFGSAGNSAIIMLYENDIVYIFLAEGKIYENDAKFRGYTSFSGFKING